MIVLADGAVIEGFGVGATGSAVGEVCFNTAMTGYEEILTDPSYAAQIVTFTFPHIGVVGVNDEDIEVVNAASASAAVGADHARRHCGPIEFSRHGAARQLAEGARDHRRDGHRHPRADDAHPRAGHAERGHRPFARRRLRPRRACAPRRPPGPASTGWTSFRRWARPSATNWDETSWTLEDGYSRRQATRFHVVAIDYGTKRNILRLLNDCGCAVTVVPATASAEEILALKPDGVVLSNGPGDPAATGEYAVPTIQALLETKVPLFGVCLGHQLLGLAVGARTVKMPQGHHGANHPVKDFTTGKVEVVSMNHGFAVDRASLPANAEETHVSLFDGSNCGIALADRPAFSVQYHPEASPGPRDSHYLFRRFVDLIAASKAEATRAA